MASSPHHRPGNAHPFAPLITPCFALLLLPRNLARCRRAVTFPLAIRPTVPGLVLNVCQVSLAQLLLHRGESGTEENDVETRIAENIFRKWALEEINQSKLLLHGPHLRKHIRRSSSEALKDIDHTFSTAVGHAFESFLSIEEGGLTEVEAELLNQVDLITREAMAHFHWNLALQHLAQAVLHAQGCQVDDVACFWGSKLNGSGSAPMPQVFALHIDSDHLGTPQRHCSLFHGSCAGHPYT
mmetsp:Transcript_46161/g.86478  ORF Transcript_46161/g.86478 Transcript_46161/m.86478 type:complete len:241 (+) Transcript_46161:150-872(+)